LKDFLLYFLRLGTFGFGGPIALAGYMQRDLVEGRRWVSQEDYLEGLAFSQLSPGPLAAQLAMYLGWLRAGPLGATSVGFAFVLRVTAAAVGAIAGAAFILARRSIVDWPTVLIGGGTLAVLLRTKKIPERLLILAAGAIGVLVHSFKR